MPAVAKPKPSKPRRAPGPPPPADVLPHELELALLFGRGGQGYPPSCLHHVDTWRRLWGEYRGIIEPKAREFLPGRRPFVRYIVGELEPPPVFREPPASSDFFRLWVAGTGRFWTQYPEPYQRNETEWLLSIGEVDREEYRRWIEWRRSPRPVGRVFGLWRLLGEYPLEVGRYS